MPMGNIEDCPILDGNFEYALKKYLNGIKSFSPLNETTCKPSQLPGLCEHLTMLFINDGTGTTGIF